MANGERPVLVAGAGPTGLTAGIELARRQIPVRVIDREPSPVEESRALVVQPRTLEIWLDEGVSEAALDHAVGVEAFNLDLEGTKRRVDARGMGGPFDQPWIVPQDVTERVLADRLRELGVEIERETELVDLEGSSDPRVRLESPRGDERLEPAWLVGADGAHSTVRHELGLRFEGAPYPERFAIADANLDTDLAEGELHAWIRRGRLLLIVPLRRPGHHRVITTQRPEFVDDPDEAPSREEIQALVDATATEPVKVHEPRWTSVFRVHCRNVDHYRVGQVLLAGDAAHIHSPAGGQGMNTGVQDAHNLAWKIALVEHGHAPASVLDSYHAERHPVGQRLLATTDRAFRLMASDAAWTRWVRRLVVSRFLGLETAQDRLMRFVSQRNIRYRDSPIVGPDALAGAGLLPGRGPRVGDQAPDGRVEAESSAEHLLEALAGQAGHTVLAFQGLEAGSSREELVSLVEILEGFEIVGQGFAVIGDGVPGPHVLVDPGGALHEAYGRDEPGYEVLRPDGHLGARLDSLDPDGFQAYRERLA